MYLLNPVQNRNRTFQLPSFRSAFVEAVRRTHLERFVFFKKALERIHDTALESRRKGDRSFFNLGDPLQLLGGESRLAVLLLLPCDDRIRENRLDHRDAA